jgi:hypothetical protein
MLVSARLCFDGSVCEFRSLSCIPSQMCSVVLVRARFVLVYVRFVFIRTCSRLLGLPFVPTLCAWLCWSPLPARTRLVFVCVHSHSFSPRSYSFVLVRARSCSHLRSFVLIRVRLSACLHLFALVLLFVCTRLVVPACLCIRLCLSVLVLALVCARSRSRLFVLVRTRLGSFVCIKYTVSTHYNEETHLCNISNLDKDIWLVFDM